MEQYIKKSALFIVALYALFAAVIGIMYVLNSISQDTLVDWLAKAGLIATIIFVLNVVLGFITQRDK